MLEPILQGLIEWLYSLFEDIADYFFGDIMDVLTMDMDYFRKVAPIVDNISEIILALAWALLIGNLVFQSIKSMMSGAGFDGEDPRILFLRTFAFSFLLLSSRQICDMCSRITGKVVVLLGIQPNFIILTPSAAMFSGSGAVGWLIAIIVSVVLIVQMIKLFFDIGERYVISCVLTFMAPLAFAMGASKNTSDIFKGWCRMYGSMNLMLIMNIVFLKLIMSAMVNVMNSGTILWVIFVLALTRVARKIDAHIAKIGLNPAQTSNNVGLRVPGGLTMVVVRTVASLVSKGATNMKGSSGGSNRSGGSHHHSHNNGSNSNSRNTNTNTNTNNNTAGRGQNASQTGDSNVNVSVNNNNPGRGSGSGGGRGGRSGDRNGRNGASTGNRYGNNSQSRSDRNTDTSRETNNRDNGRSNNRNSGGSNSRPNSSQSANNGTSQNPTPPRGSDGRSAARTSSAYANRHTHTHNADHSSSRDNSTSHDRSDHSRNTSNPTLSRNTGPQGTSSHSSSRASSSSSSNPRPPRVDVSVSGGVGTTQNVPNPNSQTVQSPGRVSGTMAGRSSGNHSDTDVSRNDRREGNTVENSSTYLSSNGRGGRPSGVRHSNAGGDSSTVYNSEHSSTTNNTYSSPGSSGGNNTSSANRRNDPASANRRGTVTHYTRDTGAADRNSRGGRRGKA